MILFDIDKAQNSFLACCIGVMVAQVFILGSYRYTEDTGLMVPSTSVCPPIMNRKLFTTHALAKHNGFGKVVSVWKSFISSSIIRLIFKVVTGELGPTST